MIRFDIDSFLHVAREVGRITQVLDRQDADAVRDKKTLALDVPHFKEWKTDFEKLGLKMCAVHTQRLITFVTQGETVYQHEISRLLRELGNRLSDECSMSSFWHLTDTEASYIEPKEPLFGSHVDNHFPSLAEDIAEAGKCIALGRYTAAVFHLMRSMEGAVQVLSNHLSIPNPSREWGKLLSDIRPKIEAMEKGELRNAWSENFSLLYHVKQAWRNDTMHPKQTYTADQATELFGAVRSFMRDLCPLVYPTDKELFDGKPPQKRPRSRLSPKSEQSL
jgi:HEPN domain-containing protein